MSEENKNVNLDVNNEKNEEIEEFEESEFFGEPEPESDLDALNNNVISYVGNYSLKHYKESLDNGTFIRPDFQRNQVWSTAMKSKLIESFIAQYPVPPVFLYEIPSGQHLIIDGYQRISTVYDYLSHVKSDKKSGFRLSVANREIKGKKFLELDDKYRKKLENTFLNCYMVKYMGKDSDKFLYNLFERLNTGGTRLNAMESRRAISYGKLIEKLEKVNRDENWRLIFAKQEEDNRFIDVELLLRILVLYITYRGVDSIFYEKGSKVVNYSNMRDFLHDFVSDFKNDTFDAELELFIETCKKVVESLGENPFTFKSSRVNYTIIDAFMTALMKNPEANIKESYDKFKSLEGEEGGSYFDNKSGTLSLSKLTERIDLAISCMEE